MSDQDKMSLEEADEYIERRILEELSPLLAQKDVQAAPILGKDSVPQIEQAFPNIFGTSKA
jgi:hypothetical protein